MKLEDFDFELPTDLIALSLIVVMHAGVLALRLGISLGRN